MPADLAIRDGTVVDGSGDPGRPADVAITGGRIEEIGPDLHGSTGDRRHRVHRRPRVHRHPHPLRRPGVLGPGPAPLLVPGGHHGGRRQLRLHHRPHPARAPRGHRGQTLENVEDMNAGLAHRGHRVGVRDLPRVPGAGAQSGAPSSTSPATSATARCASTSWATPPTSGPPPPRRSTGCAGWWWRRSRRGRPGSRPASRTPTGG